MTDYHDKVVDNAKKNIKLNDLESSASAAILDWFQVAEEYEQRLQHERDGTTPTHPPPKRKQYDTIIASDIIYTPKACVHSHIPN